MTTGSPWVSLILPCFNEMEHIESSLKQISEFMEFSFSSSGFEIILVDDFSTDGTREWLKTLTTPRCRVHFHDKNLGRGAAVKTGIRLSGGEIVGFMDVDREVSESYIPKFVETISKGADLALGRRIYRVTPHPYIILRHVLSLCYKALLRYKMHCKAVDSEVGYKFFSRRLAQYILTQSHFDDWFWDTEVTLLSEKAGFSVAEIPVAFERSSQKKSTVHVFSDSFNYLRAFKRYKKLAAKGGYQFPEKSVASTNGRKNSA